MEKGDEVTTLPTNKTAIFKRKNLDWQGKLSEENIGAYGVWVEEAEVTRLDPQKVGEVVVGKGIIFLADYIDNINNCKVEIDNKELDIINVDTFWDDDGSFHHFEITYR